MTFGPLPSSETTIRDRTVYRSCPVPGWRDVLALTSRLLDYPDNGLVARRQKALEASLGLPESIASRNIVAFAEWFAQVDPDAARMEYVATFDHKRRNALYMTYATNGDTRTRGAALLEFQNLYLRADFPWLPGELPDYLPTVAHFAAVADEEDGRAALALARPGIEVLARSLRQSRSPWAKLTNAIVECLPPLDRAAQRQVEERAAAGPPQEAVGRVLPDTPLVGVAV